MRYFLAALLVMVVVYHETFFSLVWVWSHSGTFQYGFLIIPLVVYLVWKRREPLKETRITCSVPGLVLVFGLSLLWYAADIGGVQVVKHFSVIVMIPALVITCLGVKAFRVLIFPMAYLLFAIPAGESLVYPLQMITADFVYEALKLTSIPVFREGQLLHIPAGTFEVAEACSGIRFLMATFILSILYVSLTYRSTKKRVIFLAFSLIVPVIANGIRAFLIVLGGHLISMEAAKSADHVIFGWQFFGVIMFLMFWIGARWRDDLEKADDTK